MEEQPKSNSHSTNQDERQEGQPLNPPSSPAIHPLAEDTPVSPPPVTLNPQPTTQKMEVHHPVHHHAKKNWSTHFWEFLMLFLAVSLGFLAENQREHYIENQRAKEIAYALYTELTDDSAVVANKLKIRLEKEKDMDYLGQYIRDSSLTTLPKEFYPAFTTSTYLMNTYAFEPKDGILSQLRNSGSLRYFKSIALQKLLGDIAVCINNVRSRNEQEYQYFASPIKPFILKHYDFGWLDQLRKEDSRANILDLINSYRRSNKIVDGQILNLSTFDRGEARNMILFYKQMLVSTRTLQMNNYINTNHEILQVLRETYPPKKE